MIDPKDALNEAIAHETGAGRYQVRVATAGTEILVDEPVDAGGLGSGPTPTSCSHQRWRPVRR